MANIEARLDEAAAEIRSEVAEERTEIRNDALAEAAATVQAAETLVEELTLAALQTQVGLEVTELRREVSECRVLAENQKLEIHLLETKLTEMITLARTELTALFSASQSPQLIQQAPLAQIPIPEVTATEPLQGELSGNTPNVLEGAARKKRFV